MEAEKAVFTAASEDWLERKIGVYEDTIQYIEQNIQAPDFNQGDLEEVESSRLKYEQELDELRMLKIEREMALCVGLPVVRA